MALSTFISITDNVTKNPESRSISTFSFGIGTPFDPKVLPSIINLILPGKVVLFKFITSVAELSLGIGSENVMVSIKSSVIMLRSSILMVSPKTMNILFVIVMFIIDEDMTTSLNELKVNSFSIGPNSASGNISELPPAITTSAKSIIFVGIISLKTKFGVLWGSISPNIIIPISLSKLVVNGEICTSLIDWL